MLDAILKNTGPDVQATLILSRKDGSIIRAQGVSEANTAGAADGRMYDRNPLSESHTSIQQTTTDKHLGTDDTTNIELNASPAQQLAISIFDFVNFSEKLALSMSQSTLKAEMANDTGVQSTEQHADRPDAASEEDVQLLRMRTKRQEIIIVPHPDYLMCVVQNLPKASSRYGPT